jgi:hypothetical protein
MPQGYLQHPYRPLKTPHRHKIALPIAIQILSQPKLAEATCAKFVKEIINHSITKG